MNVSQFRCFLALHSTAILFAILILTSKSIHITVEERLAISFAYSKNNGGPKMDSCGRSDLIWKILDMSSLNITNSFLCDKYFFF